MSQPDNSYFRGQQTPTTATNPYDAVAFAVWSILAKIRTMTLVKVISCTNAGDLSPIGTVTVQPLVNQLDGWLHAVPHAPIYRLPYFRLHGGTSAVILDPVAGDIGAAGFCDRDTSTVRATGAQANPGSGRMFDFADGLYFGAFLAAAPSQYVQFLPNGGGVEVVSPAGIALSAPDVRIHATTRLHVDCGGNGFVYTPTTRDDYVTGSTGATHNLNPPEVP